MSKLKLRVIEEASEEIAESYSWYESKKEGLGEEFLTEVENCFNHIESNPNGFENKYKKYRFITINRFPHITVYEVFEKEIVVFIVRSTSKDPKELKNFLNTFK